MKVKCRNNSRLDINGLYSSLKVGYEYTVLSVEFYDKNNSSFSQSIGDFTLYRIKDNEGIVIPFPSELFEIIDSSIPQSWIVYKETRNSFSLIPREWARKGFWDDYYNDDESAIEEFNRIEKILSHKIQK